MVIWNKLNYFQFDSGGKFTLPLTSIRYNDISSKYSDLLLQWNTEEVPFNFN